MGFALENVKAYVTKNTNGGSHAVLQKWSVTIDGENYPNEYANYTEILPADAAAFRATFRVPDVCSGNVMNCDNAHKKGLISDENLRFLRAGRKTSQKTKNSLLLNKFLKDNVML